MDRILGLFNHQMFMPHGHCYLWKPEILWLHVVSDLLIGLSYYSIPVALLVFVKKRPDVKFKWVFLLFAIFIWACGTTHLFDIYTTWSPNYFAEGLLKAVTAYVSLCTAFLLWPLLPKAISLPSPKQLEEKNAQLQQLADTLEERVRERTKNIIRLASIVNSSSDAIIATDVQGVITDWNLAAEHLYGYPREEAVGKSIKIIFPEDLEAEYQDIMERVLNGSVVPSLDTVRKRKDGSRIEASLTISPILDERDEIIGISSIARDISDRKRTESALRKEHEKFKKVLDLNTDGWWELNLKNRDEEFLSRWFKALFGYEDHELPNSPESWKSLIFPEDLVVANDSLQRHLESNGRRPYVEKFRYRHRDGSTVWVVCKGVALKDQNGNWDRMVGVQFDITKQKVLEDTLKQTNSELFRKNQEMEQFVYTVSHDLKSPLVTSLSFMGFLEEDLLQNNMPAVQDSIIEIKQAHQRMKELIDDILQYSRVGRMELRLQQVSLDSVIDPILSFLEERLEKKGANIVTVGTPPTVVADVQKLTQVFENILINALKYGCLGKDSTITVLFEERDMEYRVCIRDEGPGIDKEYHLKIFELFQRLQTTQEGTGVGLAIVARLMEMHGGSAWVESELGCGASFWLSLPKNLELPT